MHLFSTIVEHATWICLFNHRNAPAFNHRYVVRAFSRTHFICGLWVLFPCFSSSLPCFVVHLLWTQISLLTRETGFGYLKSLRSFLSRCLRLGNCDRNFSRSKILLMLLEFGWVELITFRCFKSINLVFKHLSKINSAINSFSNLGDSDPKHLLSSKILTQLM